MAQLYISDTLYQQLQETAQTNNQSIESVIESRFRAKNLAMESEFGLASLLSYSAHFLNLILWIAIVGVTTLSILSVFIGFFLLSNESPQPLAGIAMAYALIFAVLGGLFLLATHTRQEMIKKISTAKNRQKHENSRLQEDLKEYGQTENALLDSHTPMRTIVKGSPIILFALDGTGVFTLSEGRGLKSLGLKPKQLVGLSAFELYPDLPEFPDFFRRTLAGESVNWIAQLRGLTFDVYFLPLRDKDENVIGISGVAIDITERSKAKAEYREAEIGYSKVLDAMVESVITIDQNQQIIGFNASAERTFGYSVAEALGQPLKLLLPERFILAHREHVDRFAAGFEHSRYMFERCTELFAIRKDGTEFPIEASIIKLTVNGNSALMAFVHDISQRKRIENELREAEQFARSIVDALPAHIAILDQSGKILAVNKSWRDFAQENSTEGQDKSFVGMNYLEICAQANGEGTEGSQQIAEGIRAVIRGTLPEFRFEYPCHSLLEQRWFVIRIIPFSQNGETRVVIARTNITERRKAEQNRIEIERLQASLEKEGELITLKAGFIGAVSHEFRTPLTVINTISQLLERHYDKLSAEQRLAHFKKIRYQIQYMVEMLDDILLISKVNAGMLKFDPAPLGLEAFCQGLYEQFSQHDQGLHKMLFISTGNFDDAVMDQTLLRHILENLLSNALKYSPDGKIIELRLLRDNHDVIFQIRDEGIGIPPQDKKRLFEVFYRAANVQNISGTGLGLGIVKSSVEAHGGTIHFESQENLGTTFTVRLPISPQGDS